MAQAKKGKKDKKAKVKEQAKDVKAKKNAKPPKPADSDKAEKKKGKKNEQSKELKKAKKSTQESKGDQVKGGGKGKKKAKKSPKGAEKGGEGDEEGEAAIHRPHSSLNLVLLGPPGAGKGTQAERLRERLCLAHVASGDLFRENLRQQTELGLLAKTYMDKGELVPDDVTIAMVRARLQAPDCDRGVILDGFPRTQAQAAALDAVLADLGRALSGVLLISVPDEELVRRLSGRWICRQCQAPYHASFSPPAQKGVCDACGGELYQRDDDKPDTVRARLTVYRQQTAPLIEYYRGQGLLMEVDGSGDIEAISAALLKAACDLHGGSLEPCCGQCSGHA